MPNRLPSLVLDFIAGAALAFVGAAAFFDREMPPSAYVAIVLAGLGWTAFMNAGDDEPGGWG